MQHKNETVISLVFHTGMIRAPKHKVIVTLYTSRSAITGRLGWLLIRPLKFEDFCHNIIRKPINTMT